MQADNPSTRFSITGKKNVDPLQSLIQNNDLHLKSSIALTVHEGEKNFKFGDDYDMFSQIESKKDCNNTIFSEIKIDELNLSIKDIQAGSISKISMNGCKTHILTENNCNEKKQQINADEISVIKKSKNLELKNNPSNISLSNTQLNFNETYNTFKYDDYFQTSYNKAFNNSKKFVQSYIKSSRHNHLNTNLNTSINKSKTQNRTMIYVEKVKIIP
jgi:hypothetical protein